MNIENLAEILERPIAVKDGKFFFTKPPADIHLPRVSVPVMDKSQWSPWRIANYEYLKQELASLREGSIVLDIGAGRSPFRELTGKFDLVSIDFYPHELIDIVSDLTKPLPMKSGIFDAVIIANVLEHIPEPKELLKESFRILKSGGRIMAITPFMMPIHEAPYEFSRPTSYLIERYLSDKGFKDIRIQAVSSFYNAFRDIERDFFNAAISSGSTFLAKYFIRAWRKINSIFFKIFGRKLKNLQDDNYPHGYGFSAVKP